MRAPETGPNPFHEHIPLQVLAMAGWAGLWMLFEALLSGHGLEGRRQLGPFLAVLAAAGAAAALAVPGWLFRLLTSVRFALAQGGVLIAAVLLSMAAERWNGPAQIHPASSHCARLGRVGTRIGWAHLAIDPGDCAEQRAGDLQRHRH